jgi:HAD superfamily hydrolase (TIGR01509 family)
VLTRAILFDLGNTLIGYYASHEFPNVLRRCIRECSAALGWTDADREREEAVFERAWPLNQERADCAVTPLADRLQALFAPYAPLDDEALQALTAAFLAPIFATARLDPSALLVLRSLRALGIKTAIVSNTPWGSPADAWRGELARHQLLDAVDAVVFCTDVGWRKPHRAPFDHALSLLGVTPEEALFIGDDERWDVIGAKNAGIRPVLLAVPGRPSTSAHLAVQDLNGVLELASRAC